MQTFQKFSRLPWNELFTGCGFIYPVLIKCTDLSSCSRMVMHFLYFLFVVYCLALMYMQSCVTNNITELITATLDDLKSSCTVERPSPGHVH